MVQFFTPEGKSIPATLISAGPVTVTQVKTKETDGYTAFQVGYGTRKEKNLSKAVKGHLKDLGNLAHIRECRQKDGKESEVKRGDVIDVSIFKEGDTVAIAGTSKGKGFQGVVKRHGFHGGPRSHGQKHSEREPGSIGGGLRNRVPKGMRMAGRMGSDRILERRVKIVAIDVENNAMLVKGALPGRRGTILEITGK